MTKKNLFICFFLVLVAFWTFYISNRDLFSLDNFFYHLASINNLVSNHFYLSYFAFIFSYCLLIICNFPAVSLLSMIGGLLFGTWFGGIGIVLGATMGSFIVFILAKIFFYDFVRKKISKRYESIEVFFNKNELELLLLIRVIPAIPFFLQNLILAGLGPNKIRFIYTTFIGMAPWAFIFASIGEGLEKIFLEDEQLNLKFFMKIEYLIPLCLALSIIVLIKIFKKKI